ncbi:MAG: protein translocase subunit SecD [Candidatus Eiseniibacteriota bacterium]|nr:MAG: protein translocase subunit SecD [Candidatus Eisenbacteria bacterium]
MYRAQKWKALLVLVVFAFSVWYILPTLKIYRMGDEERDAVPSEELESLKDKALKLGLDLQGGMHLVLEVDKSGLEDKEAHDAVDRAIEIVRNRVDQFGVAEPIIQRQGENRIVVQLPGLLDPERAKSLIGQTALLEFVIVKTPDETRELLDRLDSFVAGRVAAARDTAQYPYFDPLKPISSRMLTIEFGGVFFSEREVQDVQSFIEQAGADTLLPLDARLSWSAEEEQFQGRPGKVLYFLNKKADLTGAEVATARVAMDLDPDRPDAPGVLLSLTRGGATVFSRVTGANVGRQLAIVLDGKVFSPPVIRQKIPSGEASITGNFTDREARDLAIVCRAGALPAPLVIIEERTVGPSLGRDSIEKGVKAVLVGSALVILFMLIYYRGSGFIAALALFLNVWIILAVLSAFHATLTLPGIAGIVLTIGMSVDANVLIFERIREELSTGKTVTRSIESGYQRAFRTIFDSNLTTLIAAVVLFQFGTGPIKGFAVTLSIGIIANVFTAVFVTRLIFDGIVSRRRLERLSI